MSVKKIAPTLYCYIEPFVINQNVYESFGPTEEFKLKEKIPMDELIPYLALNAKDYSIKIHSGSKSMSIGYAEEIKNYALTSYNLNNINIEVE